MLVQDEEMASGLTGHTLVCRG